MFDFSLRHRWLLVTLLWLNDAACAAEPPASAPSAPRAATDSATASNSTAPAAVPAPTVPDPAINNARPVALEPLLLARLANASLPTDFIKFGDEAAPVMARYLRATTAKAKGGMLFLPAPGQFIGDDAVITAALSVLPAAGWHVLAVQLPLLPAATDVTEYTALHEHALARARAGLAHLTQAGATAIVVIGRGANVELARELAGDGSDPSVRAVAAVGPWAGTLDASTLPLLDLAADRDRAMVKRAEIRDHEARSSQRLAYKQFILVGADRDYRGFENEITRRIQGWAEHLPLAKKAPTPRS